MPYRLIFCCVACLSLQLAGLRFTRAQPPLPRTSSSEHLPSETSPSKKPPSQAQQEAAIRLVEQLGSEQFAVRERATEQLIVLGMPAVPHLMRAAGSESREVRHRSKLVLAVVDEMDFNNRLRSFDEDAQGEKSYGLPGWERFRELAGNTETSRKLFVQMQKAERELMSIELKTGEEAAETLARCCQRLHHSVQFFRTKHELPPLVAALFVATNQDIPLHKSTHRSLMNLCQQIAFVNAITSTGHRPMLRSMLAAWILREDAVPASELLLLALQHNIPQSLPRARALAERPADADKLDRHFSVLCLAKFGGIDDVSRLETIMTDKTIITGYSLNNLSYTVEMRDIALAALLTLTKREAAAFGYRRLRLQEPFVFDTQTLGFVKDEDRQVAIAKWRIYRMRPEGR